MNTEIEFALNNCGKSMDIHLINLTERLWSECFHVTDQGPFSLESELHQLLKAAYQRIKQLERVNKTKESVEYQCQKCGHMTDITCKD